MPKKTHKGVNYGWKGNPRKWVVSGEKKQINFDPNRLMLINLDHENIYVFN